MKHALAILSPASLAVKNPPTGGNLTADVFAAQAVAELDAIKHMETGAALRALRFGIVMFQAKASLIHGQFMKWQQQTFKGAAKSQCNYYMRLSAAFVEEKKLDVAGVKALPAAQGELLPAKQTGNARVALEKALEYIDGRSLNECLADEGIKAKAKKRKITATKDAKPEETEAVREITVQDRFNEIDELLRRARKAAADKAVWMSFSKQQHGDLKAAAEQTSDFIADLYVKCHGRNARR